MANFIYSRVTIEPSEAMDKICDMIENMPQSEYGKETTTVVKTFYTEEELKKPYNNGETEYPITDTGVKHSWLYDNVGTKWITIGVDDDIKIESPSYIPDGFLIKLYSLCVNDFEDVRITCKWYDEGETECGTALIWNGIYAEDQYYIEEEYEDTELGNEKKWDDITEKQDRMFHLCEEAIETEDFNFPISKVKKIANVKYEMVTNCYPFQ